MPDKDKHARTHHVSTAHGPLLSTEIGTSKTGYSSDRISDPATQQIAVRQTGSVSAEWREILLDSPKIFPITYQDKGQDADKDETRFHITMGWGDCGNVSERQFFQAQAQAPVTPRHTQTGPWLGWARGAKLKLGRVQRLGLERVLVPALFAVCISARKLVGKSPSFPGLRLHRIELDAPVPRCRAESSLIGPHVGIGSLSRGRLKTCRLRTSCDVGD